MIGLTKLAHRREAFLEIEESHSETAPVTSSRSESFTAAPAKATLLRRALRWLGTPRGIAFMFLVGLVLRLVVAPGTGLVYDLQYFRSWAARLATVSPSHFYDGNYPADPPGYMYVLLAVGRVSRAVGQTPPSTLLLKLPAILGDLGLAWVAGELAVRLTPPTMARRFPVRPIVIAAVLFNPAIFFLSAVWGEHDVVAAFLVLCSLLLLLTGKPRLRREVGAVVVMALAMAIKPQAAFTLPAVAFALYRRHLRPSIQPRTLLKGVGSIALMAAVGAVVIALTGLPFGVGPAATLHRYVIWGSLNPYTSLWAFNLWGLAGFWQHDLTGDSVLTFAGVPVFFVGLAAFLAGVLVTLWLARRALMRGADEGRTLLLAAAACSGLGFALLTRVHERYLMVALACLAPLILLKGARRAYVILSVLYLASLYFPYVYYGDQVGGSSLKIGVLYSGLYGGAAQDPVQKKLLSAIVLAMCMWLAIAGWRWLAERSSQPR
jgi:hypothetical protein